MHRKRLLFIADRIPYPLDRGSHIRVHNLLEACATDFDVTFVAPQAQNQVEASLPTSIKRAIILDPDRPAPFSWRIWLRALHLQLGFSLRGSLRDAMQLLHALADLDLEKFDLIFAERPHVGLLLHGQRHHTIVDFDDLEHRKLTRYQGTRMTLRTKLHNYYRYHIYRRAEQRSFRDYLGVYVCSREDQEFLEHHGAHNVRILGNGAAVPSQFQNPRQRQPGQPLRAVFLGNLGYAPNLDAIEYFAGTILPLANPVVESFDVIGPNATPELAEQFAGRIKFRGFVPDLGKALAEYDVMVAPIRFGSGTKLKVLDGMAHGIPVITTRYGAEGLDLTNGRTALIADSPDDMVRALRQLSQNPDLGQTLAENAYALARTQFSWSRTQAVLREDLRTLVQRSRSVAATAAPTPIEANPSSG